MTIKRNQSDHVVWTYFRWLVRVNEFFSARLSDKWRHCDLWFRVANLIWKRRFFWRVVTSHTETKLPHKMELSLSFYAYRFAGFAFSFNLHKLSRKNSSSIRYVLFIFGSFQTSSGRYTAQKCLWRFNQGSFENGTKPSKTWNIPIIVKGPRKVFQRLPSLRRKLEDSFDEGKSGR